MYSSKSRLYFTSKGKSFEFYERYTVRVLTNTKEHQNSALKKYFLCLHLAQSVQMPWEYRRRERKSYGVLRLAPEEKYQILAVTVSARSKTWGRLNVTLEVCTGNSNMTNIKYSMKTLFRCTTNSKAHKATRAWTVKFNFLRHAAEKIRGVKLAKRAIRIVLHSRIHAFSRPSQYERETALTSAARANGKILKAIFREMCKFQPGSGSAFKSGYFQNLALRRTQECVFLHRLRVFAQVSRQK